MSPRGDVYESRPNGPIVSPRGGPTMRVAVVLTLTLILTLTLTLTLTLALALALACGGAISSTSCASQSR